MAVNIDEGEPGTFKDRWLLERDPHRFLEGMLIAAWAVGAGAVYLYLRDEYHGCARMLQRELAALQADPPGALPAIELRRGAGAYICGEESAMIESIEGKRGLPRLRPPYVAQAACSAGRRWCTTSRRCTGCATSSSAAAPGSPAQGRRGRQGLRSLLGLGPRARARRQAGAGRHHAARADRRALRRHGRRPHALRLPARRRLGRHPAGALADVPLDFDTLQPHGCFIGSAAVIVLSQHDIATARATPRAT
jgi:formate dehydrogenase beta subunit